MTAIAVVYISTAFVFLVLDAFFLSLVMRPLFASHLGETLLDEIRLVPAIVFYLGYIALLLHFVSIPQGREGDILGALWQGALLGLFAYGTYELTNFAVLRPWHVSMVITDMAWGMVLTGLSAAGGLWLAGLLGFRLS